MSNTTVKEFIVPLRAFPDVTVGKKYPVLNRNKNMCLIINDQGSNANWWIAPGEFELIEEVEVTLEEPSVKLVASEERAKPQRQMKFSKKPGSAIVTYDTGETFHISRLTSIEIFRDVSPGDDILIDVTRTYIKDGLLFQERVGIPVRKFVKIVWISPSKDDVLEQEVTITYDKEVDSLKYAMTYLADALDFTSAVEFGV